MNDLVKQYQQIVVDELKLTVDKQRLLSKAISAYCEKWQTDDVFVGSLVLKLKTQDIGINVSSLTVTDEGDLLFKDEMQNFYEESEVDYSPMILIKQILQKM